jgi:hypothetical protein
LIAVPILLLVFAASIHGDEIRGKVIGIADGDTISVLDAEKNFCPSSQWMSGRTYHLPN